MSGPSRAPARQQEALQAYARLPYQWWPQWTSLTLGAIALATAWRYA